MSAIFPELSEDKLRQLSSSAEATVYRQCRDTLGARTTVIFSLPWIRISPCGTPRDGETDFIVFDETLGVFVIEVKGGGVRINPTIGTWESVDRNGVCHEIKDPFRQATHQKHSLLQYLNSMPFWTALGLRATFGHAVIFPDLDNVSSLIGPDRPKEIIGARTESASIDKWIATLAKFWSGGTPAGIGSRGMRVVRELFCSPREVRPALSRIIDDEESEHIRLTEEQARVLRALGKRNRVVVSGGAGTGKTLLAVEKARQFAQSGLNTLLLCYNRPLAEHLKPSALVSPLLHIMSFHQLCDKFVKAAGLQARVDLLRDAEIANPRLDRFDVQLPHALAMATEIIADRFDCIVVDEAQDFGEEYWLPIELLLRDPDKSTLFIFCDHNQAIYKRVASFPIQDAPFLLTRNCRNTRFIHEAGYSYYKGEPTEPPPLQGSPVEIIKGASRDSQARSMHSHIVRLLQLEGVTPESIAIVVPGQHHKSFYSLLIDRPLPKPARWAFEEVRPKNGIIVDTMQRFKGLESAVLYVWGADELDCESDKELLYTTLTRAKSRLFLIGEEPACLKVLGNSQTKIEPSSS